MTTDTNTIAALTITSHRVPFQSDSVQSSGFDLPNRPILSTTIFPNGGLLTISWDCDCWVEAYFHNTDPEKFQIYDAVICDTHFSPPDHPVPWSVRVDHSTFYYYCQNCGFALENGVEFECEKSGKEVHSEVPAPNVEYFGGWAEGIDNCPLCNTPVDYQYIAQTWEEFNEDRGPD